MRTEALNELVGIYRPVLKNYVIRGMRVIEDRAEDFVQEFLIGHVLGKNVIGGADRERGRFRNYLLRVFKNYVLDWIRRERSRRNAPDSDESISLDEHPDLVVEDGDLERAFNLAWALQTVATAVDRVRAHCHETGRPDMWDVFDGRMLGPILYDRRIVPYEVLARRYDFKSPGQVANVLISVKRMFQRVLREVVSDTVCEDSEIDGEILAIRRILTQASERLH